MKSSAPSITSIFYLTLACLTLLAAARQWLPQESFSTSIDLGIRQARGQSPGPLLPTAGVPGAPATFTPPSVPVAATEYPAAVFAPSASIAPTTSLAMPPIVVAPAAESQPVELEATRVVARVGGEIILAGDVSSSVNTALARNGFDPNDPALKEQKEAYFQMRLKQLIETRIIINEARRKIPPEGLKKAMTLFNGEFDENVVPKMLADRKITELSVLEEQLRREGTTLERERTAFAEQILGNSWISQNTKISEDVPHHEMLPYYQAHLTDYDIAAQARWEQIMLRFDAYPTKAETYGALAQVGNQLVDGRSFADVAREISHGSTATQGGAHNWTKKGSLVSKPIDEAVFSLPVGQLSPIIEDDRGFHIIRVLERREASRIPFSEAQVAIRKKIKAERMEKARKTLLDEIRRNASVWTIYDKPENPAIGTAANPTPTQTR